ncbi:MAG: diacylglycerol kinase family protein [Bacteroidota bacterium]
MEPYSPKKRPFILARIKSFEFAIKGILWLFRSQGNAQVHLLALIGIIGMGLWVNLASWEWCCILLCMGMVLVAEAINTAIEHVTDLASPEYHQLAGRAKDVAAGAVLLAVLFCGGVWGIIFLPKLWGMWWA